LPIRAFPTALIALPNEPTARTLTELPMKAQFMIEMCEPNRANERRLIEEAIAAWQINDSFKQLPTAVRPCTLIELPHRTKSRVLRLEATCAMSSTLSADPILT
jgi:hypothetical protein